MTYTNTTKENIEQKLNVQKSKNGDLFIEIENVLDGIPTYGFIEIKGSDKEKFLSDVIKIVSNGRG